MPLTAEQLAMRKTGVTATDVTVLAGLSPFRGSTPHTVWAEKMGLEVPRRFGEQLELGHELEPIVLRRLAMRRDLTLVPGETVRSHLFAHHLATPDALHAPKVPAAVCEAKAVGLHYAETWGAEDEQIPDHVLAQVTWQMHCTGLEEGFVGALIGTEVRTYRVALDHDLVGALVEAADRFWTDHVLTKTPPAIDGSAGSAEMLRALFPRPRGPIVRASAEIEERARAYFALKAEADAAAERLEEAKQGLISACGEAEGIQGKGWRLKYGWRDAVEVKAFTRAAGRAFDMRETNKIALGKGPRAAGGQV